MSERKRFLNSRRIGILFGNFISLHYKIHREDSDEDNGISTHYILEEIESLSEKMIDSVEMTTILHSTLSLLEVLSERKLP